MNIDVLADALRREYYDASAEKGKATSALLFGVRYADHLSAETIEAIVAAAGLPESYRADVRKGARMARYVTLRDVDSGAAAASVDGASKVRQFATITIPLLTPIIFFNLVLQIIGAFQSFTQAFVVSGGTGGPSDSTMFFTLYLYQQGFGNFNMGYASAMAWLLLVIIAVFTFLNFIASKYWVFYDD